MMKRLDFYYDFSCPYAYLAHTQIEGVAARTGALLTWRPMLLGGVLNAIGNPAPMAAMSEAKAKMNLLDMHRWAKRWGVPFTMPAGHPNRTVLALRATLAAGPASMVAASKALFHAYWVDAKDLSNPEVVRAALDGAGLDGAALVARAGDQAIKDDLRKRTDEAIADGVFGAPAMVVDDGRSRELYWGQDRLGLVERALGHDGGTSKFPPNPPVPYDPASKDGRTLEFYFDVSSPFTYLASTQVEALAARTGAKLVYRPFLLGGLFKMVGTPDVPMMAMPAAKRAHVAADLPRWAAYYDVPFQFTSRFPMNTVKALRMVLALEEPQRGPFIHALFKALWVDDRDISSDAELVSIAGSLGLDGPALLAKASSEGIKSALREATNHAVSLGIFGAPSFLVAGKDLFWGQDRLDLVEDALLSEA